MDEEIRQALSEVREMKQMCGNINMKLTNIVTQRGQDIKKKLEAEYQRGLSEGNDIGYKDGVKDGQNEAWECAKKIALMDTETSENVTGYFGLFRIMENLTPMQAIAKLKAYEEKHQTDDEIKVGDEVERSVYGRTDGKGIYLEDADEGGDWLKCLFWTGATFTVLAYPKEQFKKTGRHFDIDKILEEMKE